ncbi:eukaryotic translation initiation factor 4E [Sigmodon hispidus]
MWSVLSSIPAICHCLVQVCMPGVFPFTGWLYEGSMDNVNQQERGGKGGAVVRSDRSKMATVEPETTPTTNPPPAEEEKPESNQEVANPEHYIKHPLQNRWALWFFKNDKSKTWQANLRLISKFDTVEDFWALYNHIQLSSNLMPGCDYSLFKDGIEPMWEDEKNKRGGRWLITLNKQQRRSDLDRFWLETLLCLIGESFDDYSDDEGIQGKVRTSSKDSDWLSVPCRHSYKERLHH